ncbi:chromosome segregation protein SMC [Tessaracoccus sp. OH4464_COT-324]|uniref:chromosome segregation protein SMC n=1 Tax=Tessaracoccus sp. OH4464_COT-324 TaxID=2491059 RepID=UPI000F642DBE|nr:chromosome segregation protein SMC [Tessaracoccus sp. OH4464_COT-324]RRD46271.1 chromosome segregation protein SMC [Tessaracoccus sp. OH4464_COT-324]
MYLKQLTLRGFKSFASSTTLVFEPGITCVVGPNGSGKSNVVDALSWVMGEQGAKSLRGGKMEDIIFAGTTKRAPLGRAEVELTIDNSDGALPIEYSEVTITRTMFRSGGSEYQINGAHARLLDVQELLSDSGIGREMHVIVGQGQLDTILQATPESRRGFIEEAAGVLKHRKRKEKALRKLEATRANQERLTDLVGELGRQLKPLGRQAAAARKAAFIQAELRDAKSRLLADDLVAAQTELQAELDSERALLEAKARAESALATATVGEEEAERALKQSARDYDRAQEIWYGLSALKERIASTMTVARERSRLADSQPELDISRRDPEQLEQEAEQFRAREAELMAGVAAAEAELRTAAMTRAAAEQAHSEAEVAYSRALRAAADRREGLAKLSGRAQTVRTRLEAADDEARRLKVRRAEALGRAAAADAEAEEVDAELAELTAEKSALSAAHGETTRRVAARQENLQELRHRESEIFARRVALDARVEALRLLAERKDGAAALLDDPDFSSLGRLSDHLQVAPGWEAAVTAALGSAAEAVVVGSLAEAGAAAQQLAETEGGRASIVVADAEPAAPDEQILDVVQPAPAVANAVSRLLAGIALAEDDEGALAGLEQAGCVVTRRGTVYRACLVEGGSGDGPSLIEVAAELAEARSELQALESSGQELEEWILVAEEELSGHQAIEKELRDKLQDAGSALTALQARASSHRLTADAARAEADRLADAAGQAVVARVADQALLGELEQRLSLAAAEEMVEPDPAQREQQATAARLARQQEMDVRLKLRTAEEQAKAIAGRAEGLLNAAQQERQSRAKAAARLAKLQQEAQVASAVAGAAGRLAELVDAALEQAIADRERADGARRAAEAGTTLARNAVKAAAARLDEMVRGAHREEMSRIELRMRVEQLTERAQSELGLDPATLIADYGPDQPVPQLSASDGSAPTEEGPEYVPYVREEQARRLKAAEKNLQLLGRVNPLALEEFDALTARHQFLSDQLQDIRDTRADLADIVRQVDQKVQEVFEQAYLDVERAFGKVFERLFPGGEGKLVLTEPGDWLNTGVDVEARPAGKQVKRLSLLSGGERSLVAVAFLFALFIARPSPFYILDEVEAALDDANLGRLLGIYEELRTNSQLLIITHQKRTMEIADSLYGVSMRGDGISTVVSQRLHD